MKKTYLLLALLGLATMPGLSAAQMSKDEIQQRLANAVKTADVETTQKILALDGDANGNINELGWAYPETLLQHAIGRGHINIAELLLQHNASVNAPYGPQQKSILGLAIGAKSIPQVALLLKHKANPLIKDKAGLNLLRISCSHKLPTITTLLLLHPEIDANELCYTYPDLFCYKPFLTQQRWLLYNAQEAEKESQRSALLDNTHLSEVLIKMIIDYANKPHIKLPEYPLPAGKPTDIELKETREALKLADEIYFCDAKPLESESVQRKRIKEDHGS